MSELPQPCCPSRAQQRFSISIALRVSYRTQKDQHKVDAVGKFVPAETQAASRNKRLMRFFTAHASLALICESSVVAELVPAADHNCSFLPAGYYTHTTMIHLAEFVF